jgi:Arc/MetJ family transcription regulator
MFTSAYNNVRGYQTKSIYLFVLCDSRLKLDFRVDLNPLHESNLMINYIKFDSLEEFDMRTTVTIDDALYAQALEVIEPTVDKSDLFREALKVFIRVESAKRLAALGGKAPKMQTIPRRQVKQ